MRSKDFYDLKWTYNQECLDHVLGVTSPIEGSCPRAALHIGYAIREGANISFVVSRVSACDQISSSFSLGKGDGVPHGTSLANVLLFYTSGSQPFPPGTLNYTPGRFHDSKVPKRITCFFPQVTSLAWQDNQQNSQSLKPWTAPPSAQFSYSQCFPPSSHPLRQKQRLI